MYLRLVGSVQSLFSIVVGTLGFPYQSIAIDKTFTYIAVVILTTHLVYNLFDGVGIPLYFRLRLHAISVKRVLRVQQ